MRRREGQEKKVSGEERCSPCDEMASGTQKRASPRVYALECTVKI